MDGVGVGELKKGNKKHALSLTFPAPKTRPQRPAQQQNYT